VNRTVRWIRKYIRGSEEERPEQMRVGHEIMQFLIKRETSLADALDALTMVMLNALGAKYGQRGEFSRFFEEVNRFLGSTERDRAVGLIPRPGDLALKVQPRTVTMVGDRPEMLWIQLHKEPVDRIGQNLQPVVEVGIILVAFAFLDDLCEEVNGIIIGIDQDFAAQFYSSHP